MHQKRTNVIEYDSNNNINKQRRRRRMRLNQKVGRSIITAVYKDYYWEGGGEAY